MNNQPLPIFSFYEASFLGLTLMGLLEGLVDAHPPPALDAEVEQSSGDDYLAVRERMNRALKTVLATIDEIETYPQLDKRKLKATLSTLHDGQKMQLYLAVKRLFWTASDSQATYVDDLGEAGFFGRKKEGLQIARLWQNFERRRKEWG